VNLGCQLIMPYLVAKTLGCNDGDLIADSLVGLEVKSELWVVTLNDDLGGLLNSLDLEILVS
jgi:hypothetical protein